MRPVHPGEVLKDDLAAINMSASAFADALDVPADRITSILNGDRDICADTALRLARYLGTSAELWMSLQKTYELRVAEIELGGSIARTVKPRAA